MTRTIGVMSTFRPDAEVAGRVRALRSQFDAFIVVDDGSPDSSAVHGLEDGSTELLLRTENAGIAAALNAGIARALELGADAVVTLDQDSLLAADYVAHATAALDRAESRTGVVVTRRVNGRPAEGAADPLRGPGFVEEGIQSGMLISRACLEAVGVLDERLFIDCVDTEFCLRARSLGWGVLAANGTDMAHSLGEQRPLRPFGRPKLASDGSPRMYQYHAPFRDYYITRNNVDLVFRAARFSPGWSARVIKREIGPHWNHLTSGPHRAKHALATLVGLGHGLVRRRGKIPAWLARALRTN